MRVRVYVDGFNLYYRRLRHSRYKWTDLRSLSEKLVAPDDVIERIRYFTADVSPRAGDPSAPNRQQAYFRALKTIPELRIHKGKFLPRQKSRPLVSNPAQKVLVHDTEEKGSDVNLASHLLMDGFCDQYDVALVLSQDTDLLEPMRMVVEELDKKLIIGWMEQSQPGKKHRYIASAIRHITQTMLANSQFEDPVIGRGGVKLARPVEWDPTREM
ncbi:NYN domain-containing protein [Yoonia sp. I 8.24]|uniref:NYN domain-containing protein n=1 Tax=Yoonia sp. I 8.24 TaxID=1537229 RepID=UPI001EE107FB|nr:NYN domain-containing protein [Yoonia sp. I 8.24]MCG3268476.1 NYN domain-containing protein [Yoonia sp. I 8.24]